MLAPLISAKVPVSKISLVSLPRCFKILFALLILLSGLVAYADEFTTSSFKILDPVISSPSGYQSSDDFRFQSSLSELAVGTSTAASFNLQAGFLFFPEVTLPVLAATAGDASVTLSWIAAEGFLGWDVSGYSIGQAQVSGGPYVYTSVGNVTSHTVTGLTNGTTYYFVILPEDAFSERIATSTENDATPTSGGDGGGDDGGGGGGGSGGGGGGLINFLRRQFLPQTSCSLVGDLNCDGKIDLRDFSIFLALSPTQTPNPADLNTDNQVTFRDLSLLLAGWTDSFLNFRSESPVPALVVEVEPSPPSLLSRVRTVTQAAVGSLANQFRIGDLRPGWWDRVNRLISRTAQSIIDAFSSLFNFLR